MVIGFGMMCLVALAGKQKAPNQNDDKRSKTKSEFYEICLFHDGSNYLDLEWETLRSLRRAVTMPPTMISAIHPKPMSASNIDAFSIFNSNCLMFHFEKFVVSD